ncbi:MAG: DUF1963 domain-containing protein, partial [Acetatifactor sp.]|nr:DUF1963 domain-containing protein [Acetatifactor sp.]
GRLYYAVKETRGRLPTTAFDLKKVKVLDISSGSVNPYYENVAGNIVKGDFSAIGMMEQLHKLKFSSGYNNISTFQFQVNDFSFLTQCKKLKQLDVSDTNFTDCSLLLGLPELTHVNLPEKSQLTHLEALDALPSKTQVVLRQPTEPAPASLTDTTPPAQKVSEGSEKVKAIIEEIKARTTTDCYILTIKPEKQPGLFDSKFGGLPYWDLSKPYPVGADGQKLILLGQISFEQFTVEEPLPQSGMLQFFAGQDDVFGVDWDHPDQQNNFRVVYHEEIDRSITPEQVQALDIPTHADFEFWPVLRETAVRMEKSVVYMGPADYRFEEIFRQAVKAVTGEDIGEQSFFRYLSEEDCNYLDDQLSTSGHHLLGYPYFTQYDPRSADIAFDTLLFQMDSDLEDGVNYTLWGDCGVANFFIDMEDLKKRDFSRVLYTWDCC